LGLAQDREPVGAGHPEVGDDDVEVAGRDQRQRAVAVLGGDDLVLDGQDAAEQLRDVLLVVGDEDARAAHAASGSPIEDRGPSPAGGGAWILAPWASRIACAIASPMPVPPRLVVKKGSKTWARTSGVMPGPSSLTTRFAPASAGSARSATRVAPASIAFTSRLTRTCRILASSARAGARAAGGGASTVTSRRRSVSASRCTASR